jgi:hypothetical protein
MNAEIFLNFIESSLQQVDHLYYGLELNTEDILGGMGIEEDHPEFHKIKDYLSRYGERSFCYELYHQIRVLMEAHYIQSPPQPDEPVLLLQGELKKYQIYDIVQLLTGLDEPLAKEYIPDFLLHVPGPYEHQEVVVEVKSTPKLSFSKIKSDLLKLNEFINNYNYKVGVFLAVNIGRNRILNWFNDDSNIDWINNNINVRNQIHIFSKENQDSELLKFTLNEIPQNE